MGSFANQAVRNFTPDCEQIGKDSTPDCGQIGAQIPRLIVGSFAMNFTSDCGHILTSTLHKVHQSFGLR